MSPLVRYEQDDKVAVLTMDDGKANALGPDMVAALDQALDRAEQEARAVVLAGREGRFCAGFDLRVLTTGREVSEPLVRAGSDLFLRLYGFPMPVVAACTGHAMAGGAILLMVSDARVGGEGPFKLGLNEVQIGITLPALVWRLANDRLAVRTRVQATLMATVYDPAGACEVGFLDEVVPAAEVRGRALARAQELARLPTKIYARSKASIRRETIERIRGTLDEDLEKILTGTG